jgi:hypothetical protein
MEVRADLNARAGVDPGGDCFALCRRERQPVTRRVAVFGVVGDPRGGRLSAAMLHGAALVPPLGASGGKEVRPGP